MPGKRPVKKGSFGSHFDEVVKHFPHEQPEKSDGDCDDRKSRDSNIHDRLFESAWSPAHRDHAHTAKPQVK